MAVDSRAAAPQNDATAESTCARARPGNRAACKPRAAPGSSRPTGAQTQRNSNWCDDPAPRCGRRAKKRQRRVRRIAELAWGFQRT